MAMTCMTSRIPAWAGGYWRRKVGIRRSPWNRSNGRRLAEQYNDLPQHPGFAPDCQRPLIVGYEGPSKHIQGKLANFRNPYLGAPITAFPESSLRFQSTRIQTTLGKVIAHRLVSGFWLRT